MARAHLDTDLKEGPERGSGRNAQHSRQERKPSIISEGCTLKGDIASDGVLHVEGKILGSASAENVIISTTGVVEGEIACGSLSIKGYFDGNARCRELSLASSAVVAGDLEYRLVSVASGAVVRGRLIFKPA